MLRPNNVFTLQLPIEDTNVYTNRVKAEREYQKAHSRGLVPLVYGEYGVGKTSLARRLGRDVDRAGRLVNIESAAGKTMRDIIAACLEATGAEVVKTRSSGATKTTEQSVTGSTGAASGAFVPLTFRVDAAKKDVASASETTTVERVITSPTDSAVLALCEEHGVLLLIDELHRASEELREDLSIFLKAYSNARCSKFRVTLLGTASDTGELVRKDPGIDRLIQEVHLGALTDAESSLLIEQGMKQLQISISEELTQRLVRTAVGSPSILQFLCLEVAEAAFERKPRLARAEDIKSAVDSYLSTRASRERHQYQTAIETTGEKQYRKQVLRAMAECDDEYVTMEQIRTRVSGYVGEDVPTTSLSGPLRNLKSPRYGSILRDVRRASTDERAFDYTAFSNPAMKALIRMLLSPDQAKLENSY